MTDLQFARAQMGMSLAFHIIFATVGIGMPVLMAIAEGLHPRRETLTEVGWLRVPSGRKGVLLCVAQQNIYPGLRESMEMNANL